MHSKIFQLSRKPIPASGFITPGRIPEYFIGSIADYTADCNDHRTACHQWLADFLEKSESATVDFSREPPVLTLPENAALLFFAPRHAEFCTALQKLNEQLSPETFTSRGIEWPLMSLQNLYNDAYGFYIMLTDELSEDTFLTLDDFMRSEYAVGSYYLGGVVDYHF